MHFGRAFWLDDDNELCSCPWRKDGTVEDLNWDYVSQWRDLEGVDLGKLFDIHRRLVIDSNIDVKLNAERFTRSQLKLIKGGLL